MRKQVTGGPTQAAAKDYQVEIRTTRHGEDVWLDANGNLTEERTVLTVSQDTPLVFESVPAGTYTVTENEEDAAFDDYSLEVTYSTQSSFVIHKDAEAEVTITNAYTYLYTPVRITKTVTGNMGNKKLYFGFDVYVKDAEGQPVAVEGVTDANGLVRFNIKDGEEKLLEKLPKGAVLTITEHNHHYETTIDGKTGTDGSGAALSAEITQGGSDTDTTVSYTFTIPDDGAKVDFTNDKTVEQQVVLKKTGYDNRDGRTWNLAGAVFKIYEDEDRTKPVTLDGKNEFTSGDDGVFYSGKLGAGTWYLEETVVPDGYYAQPGLFVLQISEEGVSLWSSGTIGQPDLNDWIQTAAAEPEQDSPSEDAGTVYTVSIRNTVGVALPSTGGPGTDLLRLLGFAMSMCAGIALFAEKRRGSS